MDVRAPSENRILLTNKFPLRNIDLKTKQNIKDLYRSIMVTDIKVM